MDEPTYQGLRIANTPADDAHDGPSPAIHLSSPGSPSHSPAAPAEQDRQLASATGKRRRRRPGGTQKLSPDEMRIEIERVNRLNGNIGPGIARGTHPDE